jgi:hypothetical protein
MGRLHAVAVLRQAEMQGDMKASIPPVVLPHIQFQHH